jgi:hypothetical protein
MPPEKNWFWKSALFMVSEDPESVGNLLGTARPCASGFTTFGVLENPARSIRRKRRDIHHACSEIEKPEGHASLSRNGRPLNH